MKFGEYLRQRRNALGWTQPEAAVRAGIEQSYLSKLETGRSIPSEDVFARLDKAFGLEPAALAAALEPEELERLRDIEPIRQRLTQRERAIRSSTRRWVYAGLAMVMLGGCLIGLAQVERGRETIRFVYQSSGLILPGESPDLFAELDESVGPSASNSAADLARRKALLDRLDERTIAMDEMRGPTFFETEPKGRRLWRLVGSSPVRTSDMFGWAYPPALALIIGGLGCFFISWRRP